MALCVLTAGWKSDGRSDRNETSGFIDGLVGIIVDHRLRSESSEEATQVRDRVNKIGIRCEIACCDWPDGRPKKGHLQEAAREMRKIGVFVSLDIFICIFSAFEVIMHGYAIVDLEKLNPSDVEDLCLSKFLALILQFISQRNRPIRGSISKLLLGYIRNIPCKVHSASLFWYHILNPEYSLTNDLPKTL
ncbi:hypothetical protein COCNU_03G012090 [Cocos nucifera]|uniref:tRNA(Ile)-lysidine/2-thiocytidine synthase N-terminal domain-containing protein n=1 Tax=Cocos nucifera TaxID=13894 RepID=A0A8K0I4F7_COCNU|nr:hypothetical protein COCNU_03G012090 [Cocos nucifera]